MQTSVYIKIFRKCFFKGEDIFTLFKSYVLQVYPWVHTVKYKISISSDNNIQEDPVQTFWKINMIT